MTECRKYPRMRVLKSAKIVLGASSVFDCVVRDLTIGGTCVKIPMPSICRRTLPSPLMLDAHADRVVLPGE